MAQWVAPNPETDEYPTPKSLVRPMADALGGFDLDPASGAEDTPHAENVYTKADDGLSKEWFGTVFCNPPFSAKIEWLKKAIDQTNSGNADTVVMVLPVDTSTNWYHRYVTQATAVCFLGPGRTDFSQGRGGSPNFNFMLCVFGDIQTPKLLHVLESKGVVYHHGSLHASVDQTVLDV